MLSENDIALNTTTVNAAAALELDAHQVHVWISRTDLLRQTIEGLAGILDPDELERADLYGFERRRNQFIVSRGFLRVILARYLERPAGKLSFSREPWGKPRLARGSRQPQIQFNLSHSGKVCVVAVTRLKMVGVDVEETRPEIDIEAVARRILTDREWAVFDELSAGERCAWFYRAWSKKEALVKAIGVGMSIPFQEVEIAESWRTRSGSPFLEKNQSDISNWWTQSFIPAPGYVGAVATLGTPSSIHYRREDYK